MCFRFVQVLVTTAVVLVLICAADKAHEESLKKTIEVDRLIDMVSDANPREVNAIYIFNPELALYIFF